MTTETLPAAPSDLTLHERRMKSPLPALQATAGLSPALIGRGEGLLELPQLGAVAPQEVAAAQVDGDHQTFVAVEGLLHLLMVQMKKKNYLNFKDLYTFSFILTR